MPTDGDTVRITVDLSREDAAALEAAMARLPVPASRSSLLRVAIRRGLRALATSPPSQLTAGGGVRC